MRYFLVAAIAAVLAGCTSLAAPLSAENAKVLAASCENGEVIYSNIVALSTVGTLKFDLKAKADGLYAALKPICDKGAAATQADIVLAGAQVYALTKVWRDAT
jgi:hypothetical protein